MPSTLTLSVIGALSVAGAATGVYLGHAAIDEINPAYFHEPETTFHSALAANAPSNWEQVQAQEQSAVPITSCIGCINGPLPDYPVDYVPGHDPYVDTAAVTRWPARTRQAPAAESPVVYAEEAPAPVRERIVRYASYAVTQDEADAMAKRDAEASANAGPDAVAQAPATEVAATQ